MEWESFRGSTVGTGNVSSLVGALGQEWEPAHSMLLFTPDWYPGSGRMLPLALQNHPHQTLHCLSLSVKLGGV